METSARQPNFSQEETDALVREVQSRSGRIYGHANRPPRVDDAKAAWEEQHTTREEEEEEEEEQQQQVVRGEEKEGEDEDDREEEDQGEPEPVPETREGAGRGDEPATRGRRRNRVQREDQPFLDTQRAGFLMLERELGSMGTRLGSLEAQVKALQDRPPGQPAPLSCWRCDTAAAGPGSRKAAATSRIIRPRLSQVAAEAAHKRGAAPWVD
ncbi:myb-related transcription factor%2C partner of profilin-like [Xyrichtys novacula]|uniref:Myb-related transcription factor, partner of profilin-like n=1 Tax=Xyrichtys novacula TaxID=13765 RepID=A0AAV1GA56_XYRNO|nr:myb-related transcription factor%2C partner of profilin-like [Xyrichtys novacula]